MKLTVTFNDFEREFLQVRPENFSREGLKALFEYLTELEDETGQELELDVIALCCDFSELTEEEFKEHYPDEDLEDCEVIITKLKNDNLLIQSI